VPLAREGSSPFHLRRPPRGLALEDTGSPFELTESRFQVFVGQEPEILVPELVEGRPQRTHDRPTCIEHVFEML
jgi:hypothetical protein